MNKYPFLGLRVQNACQGEHPEKSASFWECGERNTRFSLLLKHVFFGGKGKSLKKLSKLQTDEVSFDALRFAAWKQMGGWCPGTGRVKSASARAAAARPNPLAFTRAFQPSHGTQRRNSPRAVSLRNCRSAPKSPSRVTGVWDATRLRRGLNIELNHTQNFERLVLLCMDSYDSESRHIFKAFFEIYKISIPFHRSNFKISVKIRQTFCEIEYWIFNFLKLFVEFCYFEAKFWWNVVGISPNFSENDKLCRESDKIP